MFNRTLILRSQLRLGLSLGVKYPISMSIFCLAIALFIYYTSVPAVTEPRTEVKYTNENVA